MKKKKTFKKKGKGRNPSIMLVSHTDGSVREIAVEEETDEVIEETAEDTAEEIEEAAVEAEEVIEDTAEETAVQFSEEPEEEPVPDVIEDTVQEAVAEEPEVIAEPAEEDRTETPERTADVQETAESVPEPAEKEIPDGMPQEKHGYWIHHRVRAEGSMSGYFYLSTCDCSVCGYTANMEKKVCHSCGAVMDLKAPEETF